MKIKRIDYPFNGFEESMQAVHTKAENIESTFPMIEKDRNEVLTEYLMYYIGKAAKSNISTTHDWAEYTLEALKILIDKLHPYEMIKIMMLSYTYLGAVREKVDGSH